VIHKTDSGLDVHDVALPAAVYEADYVAKFELLDGITAEEVGRVVGFFTEP
jgi:hypothetical protein